MSKFRLELDIAFDTENDMIAFVNLVETLKEKVYLGTVENGIPVIKKCRYHECFHDEDPPKQCGNYKNIDFDNVSVLEHTTEDGKVITYDTITTTTKEKIRAYSSKPCPDSSSSDKFFLIMVGKIFCFLVILSIAQPLMDN